ncbi:MAG TPA: hypothetical protein VN912_06810, partial [Candidatus Angelobacter sp.]|nr:hypothetical protein [Candidatus Angelobacter sp.]
LPIANSLLYIEPIYLEATNLQIPQLKKVIAATGQNVVMEDTLDKALSSLLGTATPTTPSGPGTAPSGTVAQLIAQANQDYANAQAALIKGDFTTYAADIQALGKVLQQLGALAPAGSSASASPTPSASASP